MSQNNIIYKILCFPLSLPHMWDQNYYRAWFSSLPAGRQVVPIWGTYRETCLSRTNHLTLLIISIVCFAISTQAQTSLTIDQAIEIALKNNYDIIVSKNQAQQAANNNNLGNAGMLPKVDLNASGNFANNTIKQEFASGLIVDKSGVQSQNISSGAYLTWTVFDGLKMFATHERLKELESMGMLNTKIQMENTIVNVIDAYYSIAMQKQLMNGLKENITVSEERLKIAQKKYDVGATAKTDVLQAKIDLNALKSSLLRQSTLLSDAKAELNQLLVQPVEQDIDVTDSIPLMNQYKYEDLKNSIAEKNTGLLFAQRNIEVSRLIIREGRSAFYPKLDLNANYIFSRSQNQAGFSLLNQNLGLNLGFTASWTIFNGFTGRNNLKNLQLNFENSKMEYENQKTLTQLGLVKSFKKYQDDISILELEEENNKLAKENLNIALERFRLGANTYIELKEAQKSYEESTIRLSNARFSTKLSETQLLKLSGGIIK
ncbi:MAG: TolC family protein [Bacteroidota bacterium]